VSSTRTSENELDTAQSPAESELFAHLYEVHSTFCELSMAKWPTTFFTGEVYASCVPVLTYLCSHINLMMTALKVDQSQTIYAIYQAHDHCSRLSVVCTVRYP
jgi:hypothetical protein